MGEPAYQYQIEYYMDVNMLLLLLFQYWFLDLQTSSLGVCWMESCKKIYLALSIFCNKNWADFPSVPETAETFRRKACNEKRKIPKLFF